MGAGQSVRKTDFPRPLPSSQGPVEDEASEKHQISISKKIVERLVDDAAFYRTKATPKLKEDIERAYIEKLKSLDETHSEQYGITVDKLNTLVNQVEKRTAHMVDHEPVCEECKIKVIECYDKMGPTDITRCWDTVGAFTACVQAASKQRLRAHTEHEDIEREKRERRVARARHHALRDLSTPVTVQ